MSVQIVRDKPLLIGLTGGIASGKTTVSNFFKDEGIPVIDSDLIVKSLWEHDVEMVKEIEQVFGISNSLYLKNELSKIIFKDKEQRNKLNQIIHPRVFSRIDEEKKKFQNAFMMIIDMPLLIEVGYQRFVDQVILVYVDQETQIKRLMKRDQINENEALVKIQSQMSMEEKKAYADIILDNTKDILSLKKSVIRFLKCVKNEK